MNPPNDDQPVSEPVVRQGSAPHGAVDLDELDRRIMRLLRRDGRLTYAHIARTVGVSEPTVRKRVDRLLHAGAIYIVARVNPAPIGFPIDALVGIRVERGRAREVGDRLAGMENVAYVSYLAGSFDIMIEAFLPDTEGLFKFLNEDLEQIDGIVHTETWHVLRTDKFNYMWEGENVGLGPVPVTDGRAAAGGRAHSSVRATRKTAAKRAGRRPQP
jgi:Lrp/AsnC family transcriptional regulator for asnA, asnC and gidA